MSYWYVATPYAKYPKGHLEAYKMACRVTAWLAKVGVPVLSPIAHGQGLSDHGEIGPTDHGIWMRINEPLMRAARGIIVVEAEGWEASRGIAEEIAFFRMHGRPIHRMHPDDPAALVATLLA